jgi:hypothetical protein
MLMNRYRHCLITVASGTFLQLRRGMHVTAARRRRGQALHDRHDHATAA